MASSALEFWVGYGSTCTCRSVMRIDALAARAGVEPFGAPTFRVGDEPSRDDDRLEDAIEWCCTGRLAPSVHPEP